MERPDDDSRLIRVQLGLLAAIALTSGVMGTFITRPRDGLGEAIGALESILATALGIPIVALVVWLLLLLVRRHRRYGDIVLSPWHLSAWLLLNCFGIVNWIRAHGLDVFD